MQSYTFPNRTRMLHMHNEAFRRSFFFSMLFQQLNRSRDDFELQPGMLYYYLGALTEVTAFPDAINGSAVLFDHNTCYAGWYTTLLFNQTLDLFAPRAYRLDDSNEPYNWLREPTNNTFQVRAIFFTKLSFLIHINSQKPIRIDHYFMSYHPYNFFNETL